MNHYGYCLWFGFLKNPISFWFVQVTAAMGLPLTWGFHLRKQLNLSQHLGVARCLPFPGGPEILGGLSDGFFWRRFTCSKVPTNIPVIWSTYELFQVFRKKSAITNSLQLHGQIWADILSCNFVFQCSLKRHRRVDPPKEEFADGGLKILVACLCKKLAFWNHFFGIVDLFWMDFMFYCFKKSAGGKRCTVAGDNFEAFFKRTADTAAKWVKKSSLLLDELSDAAFVQALELPTGSKQLQLGVKHWRSLWGMSEEGWVGSLFRLVQWILYQQNVEIPISQDDCWRLRSHIVMFRIVLPLKCSICMVPTAKGTHTYIVRSSERVLPESAAWQISFDHIFISFVLNLWMVRKRETLLDPGYVQELDQEVLATRGNVESFLFPKMVTGQVPNRLVWLRSSFGLLMQVGWLVRELQICWSQTLQSFARKLSSNGSRCPTIRACMNSSCSVYIAAGSSQCMLAWTVERPSLIVTWPQASCKDCGAGFNFFCLTCWDLCLVYLWNRLDVGY